MPEYENYYEQCHNEVKKHKILYHYTAFDTLLQIITYKKFRLSTLSLLNDSLEYRRLSNEPLLQNRIYVSCFNHFTKDTIPLWKMYADGLYGIRIGFPKKSIGFIENKSNYEFGIVDNNISIDDNNPKRHWKIQFASLIDVIYDDDFAKYNYEEDIFDDDDLSKIRRVNAIGYLKKKDWEFEGETRVCVVVQPDKDIGTWLNKKSNKFEYAASPYKYVYCNVPDPVLRDIRITFSPRSNDQIKEMMKREIMTRIKDFSPENFVNSAIEL